jgi:UDP-N-acetylmuramoylalanine--D-glutamate ligase
MRHTICWADLAGAKVGVWGLGVEGDTNLRRLLALGADVVLVDDVKREHAGREVLPTDGGGLDALLRCDAVVKSPGISRHRSPAERIAAAGVPLLGGLGLWLQAIPLDRVVMITGTKGKSTTSAMLGHLLTRLGHPTFVGGNIGRPPWDLELAAAPEPTYWVIETSSYQATDVAVSPHLTAVTSLHPDHLDWHGSVEQYYADKLSLCHQPGARRTVASASSPDLVARAALLAPDVDWVAPDATRRTRWHARFGVRGDHNLDNAEIAARCLAALGIDVGDADLAPAAEGFQGLDHRLSTVDVVDGVEFVDDSLSTNVLPTLRAIEAFPDRRCAVIVGGHDRGIDYHSFAGGLAGREAPLLVLTIPDSGPRIHRELAESSLPSCVELAPAPDLDRAVAIGHDWAGPGGVVLLSPAAPSFGIYRDYRARAAAFAEAVANIASR